MTAAHRRDNRVVAVRYRELGFATIPLLPRSKTPAIRSPHPEGSPERGRCRGECGQLGHGFHDASTDVEWADQYWSAHPDHGIAVRPDPGIIVLDVDPRHGGDVALWGQLCADGLLLPRKTFAVVSGRNDGGRHLWFKGVAGPVRTKLCTGVDILCHDRNAVTMPPSEHWKTGQAYTFAHPIRDIADAPARLIELATRPNHHRACRCAAVGDCHRPRPCGTAAA